MARLQPKAEASPQQPQAGLKVVDNDTQKPGDAVKAEPKAPASASNAEAGARRRLHPPRVWPD